MTALKKFQTLEATAQWVHHNESEPQEVILSLGKASLIVLDLKSNPLSHWSLSAIRIEEQEKCDDVILYTEEGSFEHIVLSDPEMIEAIRHISKVLLKSRSRFKGKKRKYSAVIAATAATIIGVYGSDFMTMRLLNSLPDISKDYLVEHIEDEIVERFGAFCEGSTDELANLSKAMSMSSSKTITIKIHNTVPNTPLMLPAGHIIISDAYVLQNDTYESFANGLEPYVLNALSQTPLKQVLDTLPFKTKLHLWAKGTLPSSYNVKIDTILVEPFDVDPFSTDELRFAPLPDLDWIAIQGACFQL